MVEVVYNTHILNIRQCKILFDIESIKDKIHNIVFIGKLFVKMKKICNVNSFMITNENPICPSSTS